MLLTLFLSGLLIVVARRAVLPRRVEPEHHDPAVRARSCSLAWSISCGEAWALPVGAGVGTFLVQTHVSYGFTTAASLAAGLVGAAITAWRRRAADAHTASACARGSHGAAVTVVVLVVLWLPVAIQQLTSDAGNLGTLVRFFRDHGREHSYGDAWHVDGVAAQRRGPTGCAAASSATSTAARST